MKIGFISLGCDKNLADSEIMLGLINERGYEITYDYEEADVIIINSCGFIAEANSEAIENILDAADYKETGKLKGIIVTGCTAQRYKEEIFKELPCVDAVVGTGDFEKIGEVLKKFEKGERKITLITDKNKPLDEKNSLKRMLTTIGGFAYLKIAEGCDNFCTYCTIPFLRGRYRSRTLESLVDEAKMLAGKGVKELILIAQDTSLYGTDIYEKNCLHKLIKALSNIEGIEWIRLMYCYPEHITDETISEMAENPKVCHYIDMPIQHCDDDILNLMGRKSSRKELEKIIYKLRKAMPDICIRTTLLTGFPGETQEQFQNMADFIKKIKFDRLGVFEYSREEGTKAFDMPNQIDDEIKHKRKEFLMEIQREISAEKCSNMIGKILKVIVEGKIDNEEYTYCARSYRDCYEIDGFVFFKSQDELLAGDFYNIKITDSSDYDLMGEIYYESAE